MDELTAQNLREDELVDLEASGLLQQVGSFASDSFPVPVVRDYNTIFQGVATDNGASLQGVSFVPHRAGGVPGDALPGQDLLTISSRELPCGPRGARTPAPRRSAMKG